MSTCSLLVLSLLNKSEMSCLFARCIQTMQNVRICNEHIFINYTDNVMKKRNAMNCVILITVNKNIFQVDNAVRDMLCAYLLKLCYQSVMTSYCDNLWRNMRIGPLLVQWRPRTRQVLVKVRACCYPSFIRRL